MDPMRRELVKKYIHTKPFVTFHELAEKFSNVSSMTLRRDVEYLINEGEAIKARGGVKSMKFFTTSMEDKFSSRSQSCSEEKERIAHEAVSIIEGSRSVFLDSGTTMLRFAAEMPDDRLTVTTTGPNVALELIKKPEIIVNMVGGMLNRDNISVSGNQAMSFIENINIDVAFIVPSGLSASSGLSSGNYNECELKKLVVSKARKVVALIDHSKEEQIMPYTFCSFEDIDVIVADKNISKEIIDEAKAHGVQLRLV